MPVLEAHDGGVHGWATAVGHFTVHHSVYWVLHSPGGRWDLVSVLFGNVSTDEQGLPGVLIVVPWHSVRMDSPAASKVRQIREVRRRVW